MPRRLGGKAPPASGHGDNVVGHDGLALAPGSDPHIFIIEEDGGNPSEAETTGDRQPVMSVHDEELAAVDTDRLSPSLLTQNSPFELPDTIRIGIFGRNQAGKIQEAVLHRQILYQDERI
nr:hypothetical protein [Methylobacterium indicum]